MQIKTLDAAEIAAGYASFISQGFLSLVGSDEKVLVTMLRDSGALDSFVRESVLLSFLHKQTQEVVSLLEEWV